MICWLRNSFYLKNRRYLIMLRLPPCQTRGSFQNQQNHNRMNCMLKLTHWSDQFVMGNFSFLQQKISNVHDLTLVIDAKSLLWKSNLNLVKFRPLAIHGRLLKVDPTFNKWTRTYYKTLLVNCLEMQGKWSDRIFYVFILSQPFLQQSSAGQFNGFLCGWTWKVIAIRYFIRAVLFSLLSPPSKSIT